MKVQFERVTFTDDTKRRTVILQLTSESERFLSGYEVDSNGDEIQPKGFDRRLRMIDKTLIIKRTKLKQNRTYGTLEVDK